MSKAIRILSNEIIEIMDIVNANALFQTNEYPEDEIFYKLRKQINPFDLYYENERLNKEKSILEKSLKLIWKKDIKIDYEELDKANKIIEKEVGDDNE